MGRCVSYLHTNPADPDDYEKEGVWPEPHRAEANRFAVALLHHPPRTIVINHLRAGSMHLTGKETSLRGLHQANTVPAS